MPIDILVRGGTVVDPSQSLHKVADVAVKDGKIVAVGEEPAAQTVDARGLLVVPGLIDLHVHVYRGHVSIGLDPDPLCPAGGVTTLVDAGSAGSFNFDGFRRDVIDRAETRILALVNLSCMGLVAFPNGELLERRYADVKGAIETLKRHPGVAVGVKIRAGAHIIGPGEQGWANLKDAVAAARGSGTWLMVHIGESPMPIPELVELLQPGDCVTHCFKGGTRRILDAGNQVFPAVRKAAERGVVFDVGHGFGSFQWDVVEAALRQGFEPTTISTDLHTLNLHGPVYDMPTTMSKFLMLGVPLDRVVAMATSRPARVLGRDDLGTLRPGAVADIAILEERHGSFEFTDSYGGTRVGQALLNAVGTIRGGKLLAGGGGLRMRRAPS